MNERSSRVAQIFSDATGVRASGGTLGVHVAHFRPMCLTARNSLRHPTGPITSRTGPTRFDARSWRGGRPERTLGEHPHVLGGRVVSRKGVDLVPFMDAPPARAGALSGAGGGELCVCAPGSRGGTSD